MKDTYSLAYRTGGTSNAKWHRVSERYATRPEAASRQAEIETMGYKTLVYKTKSLDAVGLPAGYEASLGYEHPFGA